MFRASLAVDQKLPWDLVGTVEAIYTKTLNNVIYYNVNVEKPTEFMTGADNRPINTGNKIDNLLIGGMTTIDGYKLADGTPIDKTLFILY